MGTSTSSGGGKAGSPFDPEWLDQGDAAGDPSPDDGAPEDAPNGNEAVPQDAPENGEAGL